MAPFMFEQSEQWSCSLPLSGELLVRRHASVKVNNRREHPTLNPSWRVQGVRQPRILMPLAANERNRASVTSKPWILDSHVARSTRWLSSFYTVHGSARNLVRHQMSNRWMVAKVASYLQCQEARVAQRAFLISSWCWSGNTSCKLSLAKWPLADKTQHFVLISRKSDHLFHILVCQMYCF